MGDLKAALDGDPNNADTLLLLSNCYLISGRVSLARPLIARLQAVDPLTPVSQCLPGFADLLEGNFAAALTPYRRMFEMDRANPMAALFYVWVLALNDRIEEVDAVVQSFPPEAQASVPTRLAMFLSYAIAGNRHEAQSSVTPDIEAVATATDVFPRILAQGYALAGDPIRALHWLARHRCRPRLHQLSVPRQIRSVLRTAARRSGDSSGFWRTCVSSGIDSKADGGVADARSWRALLAKSSPTSQLPAPRGIQSNCSRRHDFSKLACPSEFDVGREVERAASLWRSHMKLCGLALTVVLVCPVLAFAQHEQHGAGGEARHRELRGPRAAPQTPPISIAPSRCCTRSSSDRRRTLRRGARERSRAARSRTGASRCATGAIRSRSQDGPRWTGARAAARLATGSPTPRERAYIAAVAALFEDAATVRSASASWRTRTAMEAVQRDIRTISRRDLLRARREPDGAADRQDLRGAAEGGAILEPLLRQYPDHPGLAHYIIHAYDHPPLARARSTPRAATRHRAVRAARAAHAVAHVHARRSWRNPSTTNLGPSRPR